MVMPLWYHIYGRELNYISGNTYDEDYWLSDIRNYVVFIKIIEFFSSRLLVEKCEVKLDANKHIHLLIETSDDEELEDICFPAGFPQQAPMLSINGKSMELDWQFDGDIYKSFVYSYGMYMVATINDSKNFLS